MLPVESHRKWLGESDPAAMAHGTYFPIEVIEQYLTKRCFLWDMGCGVGGAKIQELERRGFHPRGIDINRRAVDALCASKLWASCSDVCLFGSGDLLTEIPYIEMTGGMLCQGLFPSLLGDSWKSALDAMDMWMRPSSPGYGEGYLFVADVMMADKIYPELCSTKAEYEYWRRSANAWKARYERNNNAFGDIFLEGTFLVGAVGPRKNWLDWEASSGDLREIYENRNQWPYSEVFERMARHLSDREFDSYLVNRLRYRLVHRGVDSWESRSSDSPAPLLPGMIRVYQKPEFYRYHPWYCGWMIEPYGEREVHRKEIEPWSPYSREYDQVYFERLMQQAPQSQKWWIREALNKLSS